MNGRELYEAIYAGRSFDRIPIAGIGGWAETLERWRTEGLGPDEDPSTAAGLLSDDTMSLQLNLNMYPLFEVRLLDRGERHVTVVDEFGVTKKMMTTDFSRSEGRMTAAGATSAMSHWIDFPVKDMVSWKTLYEERFRADGDGRIPYTAEEQKAAHIRRSEQRWVRHGSFPFGGLFSALRQLMGLEGAVFAMADDPDLVHTIVSDLSDFYVRTYARIVPELRLDMVICFEDMCSNRAPLVSPAMFEEFFAPGYRKYLGSLAEMSVKQRLIDTDGDCRLIIPELLSCGFTGLHPCEIKAGMDPRPLLEQYPSISCNGGIDKTAVAKGGKDMEQEIAERFKIAWELGRYTPSLDHSFPPDISWQNALRYAELTLELSGSAPR
jgi:uroporphyrinogen decarboxylase